MVLSAIEGEVIYQNRKEVISLGYIEYVWYFIL